MVKSDRYA